MSVGDGADLAGGSPPKMVSVAAGTTMTRGTAAAGAAAAVISRGHSADLVSQARKCMDSASFRASSVACAGRERGAGTFALER
jgi:hypothetical protein